MGDYRTTSGEEHPLPLNEKKRKRNKKIAVGSGVAALLVAAGFAVRVDRGVTATGYVMSESHAEVRPSISGRLAELAAFPGDTIEKGDLLARLDASEALAALDEAKSRVRQVEADIAHRSAAIKEEIRLHKESMESARLRLKDAEAKRTRAEDLVERGLAPASTLEDAVLKQELVQAELASLEKKDLSVYDMELDVMRQELEARKGIVGRFSAQLANHEIRAPISGRVLRYDFALSSLVTPDNVLFEIFGGHKQQLRVRVSERYAAKVEPGQRYSARLAAYSGLDGVVFTGRVERLREVIQSEGQFSYRVAYCDFSPAPFNVPPGAGADVRIYYGRSSLWLFLLGLD